MEALPRRPYNRLLWKTAARGLGAAAHVTSVAAALLAAGVYYLRRPDRFADEAAIVATISVAIVIALEILWLLSRRMLSAPHELDLAQVASIAEREAQLGRLEQQVGNSPGRGSR
jgi:hypothetical protein